MSVVRFIVNIDQGLDFEKCGFFLYREQHERRMCVFPNVELRANAGFSFSKALTYICKYLETHAVDGYQIIIVIRSCHETGERNLLRRLLQLDYHLECFGFFNVVSVQSVISLVVIHQEEGIQEVGDTYLLSDECSDELGKLNASIEKNGDSSDEDLWLDNIRSKGIASVDALAGYFGSRYQLIEEHILDGDSVGRLTQMLRFVKFVTFQIGAINAATRMRDICIREWQSICREADETIREEYREHLLTYKADLEAYIELAESDANDHDIEIPKPNLEANRGILSENEIENEPAKENESDKPKDLRSLVDEVSKFRKHLPRTKEMQGKWEIIYQNLVKAADRKKKNLEEYSDSVEKVYSGVLAERRKNDEIWKDTCFVVTKDLKDEIDDLEKEKKIVLEELKEPQMKPQTKFQDWLNFRSKLKNRNQEIIHYIQCIRDLSARLFWSVIILMVLSTALFYSALQLMENLTSSRIKIMGGYLVGVLILFTLSWYFPITHYKGRIKKSLVELEKEVEQYLSGYRNEISLIVHYFNRLSYLDYIDRCLEVRIRTLSDEDKVEKWRQWHLLQAQKHRDILDNSYSVLLDGFEGEPSDKWYEHIPVMRGSVFPDVVDCKLYWPL